MNETLKQKLSGFPDKPGVYLMKNSSKKILYVGKAINLRKRIRSYFSGEKEIKTRILVENIADIEIIVTANEQEALLLENNLIKQWKPRYNINLKDGKTYPVIRLTNEAFPRIYKTRRIVFDGSEYFGPYANVNHATMYLKTIEELYPLRKCKDRNKPKTRQTPCLYYHIHRCRAPCCGFFTQQQYMDFVVNIKKLLSGNIRDLTTDYEQKMLAASRNLQYEKAAVYRDQLEAVKQFNTVQRIIDFKQQDRDYLGFACHELLATFIILQMRDGKLVGRELFRTEIYSTPEEALLEFFTQYYGKLKKVPPRIFLPLAGDEASMSYFIREVLGKQVKILFPKRGGHLKLIKMAVENAREDLKERCLGEKEYKILERLQTLLGLDRLPKRIEGFDISHLAGRNMVGAMVSFLDARPDKRSYRYFKIKSLARGQIDDFEAIRETVARRYTRVLNDNLEKPDLILIDGGKGQLGAAGQILQALGLSEISVIGLAKKQEEIFMSGQKEPLLLEKTDPALRLLIAVRDEAHRFGIRLNRRLSNQELAASLFTGVKGIGRKKSRDLLTSYGSIKNILNTQPAQLAKSVGLSLETARELIAFLKQNVT